MCLNGFAYNKGHVKDRIQKSLFHISHHVSNSLAIEEVVPSKGLVVVGDVKDGDFVSMEKLKLSFWW
ncbi:hypothetical protein Fmac_006858 [Flemingia macrophylla]|uniref:Uncharacterized protein n=1 Tax=Flemingia macrophylla TaxID=520843 RepID=A0ABD1NDB5_9FABA